MTIQVGDPLPDATLTETTEFGEACPLAPQKLSVAEQAKGKKVVVFGVPGAYTPTCSAKHLPGYIQHMDDFRRRGMHSSHQLFELRCVQALDQRDVFGHQRDEHGGVTSLTFR